MSIYVSASIREAAPFIIQIFLPDFVEDFGALKVPSEEVFHRADTVTLAEIMTEPTAAEEDSSLIKASSLMIKQDLINLPVVQDGRLVGIASRVDIGGAFFDPTAGRQRRAPIEPIGYQYLSHWPPSPESQPTYFYNEITS